MLRIVLVKPLLSLPLSTNRTRMTFDTTMRLIMRRQARVTRERLPTHRTYKTLLIGMRPHMLEQTERLCKRLSTDLTVERFLARMCPQVPCQVIGPRETLTTLTAQVSFGTIVNLKHLFECKTHPNERSVSVKPSCVCRVSKHQRNLDCKSCKCVSLFLDVFVNAPVMKPIRIQWDSHRVGKNSGFSIQMVLTV